MKNRNKFKNNEKLLDKEEEYKLIRNWQKNKSNNAINKLLSSYKKLVVSISKKFSSYGLPQEDLIQEGTMGLVYAIERFDTSKGFRLYTYSHWWIKAMIQDYIIKNWSIVKNGTTASQKILFFSFNKIKKLINFDSLKTMDIDQVKKISKMLNIKPLDIENLDSDHRIFRSNTDKINKRKQANGISPNFVHALDATHMYLTIDHCIQKGIRDFGMVHDSYATLACDMDKLNKCTRSAFIQMYTEMDPLENFRDQITALIPEKLRHKIPPLPEKGKLDIEEINKAAYFFS